VLASGDPLCYGIGASLRRYFPPEAFEIIPAPTAFQLAFAALAEPWSDAALLSAHARPIADVVAAARLAPKAAILTDSQHTPAALAQALLEAGFPPDLPCAICENLGSPQERLIHTNLGQVDRLDYAPLNVFVVWNRHPTINHEQSTMSNEQLTINDPPTLQSFGFAQDRPSSPSASLRTGPPALRLRSGQAFQPFGFAQDRPSSLPTFQPSNLPAFQPSSLPTFQPSNPPAFQPSNPPAFQISPPGLPDAAFSTAANQITKREIRLLVLAELALCPGEIMWDIGTGSGSVSLEAARAVPAAMVYAIEKRAELLQHARENLARFPAPNVHLMEGVAPDDLGAWPDPDAVFIGGSGGRLAALIEATQRRLRAGGRLVINLATVENLAIIRRLLPEAQVNQIQINRGVPIMDMLRFEALNPVFIVKWRLDNR
jgi:precorrin-6Y C5,15-methyltransferase (decarboxylating) CbiT subunit